LFAVNEDSFFIVGNFERQNAVNAVVFDQMRHCFGVGNVVDGNNFNGGMIQKQAK
jgi:hypothetical protein